MITVEKKNLNSIIKIVILLIYTKEQLINNYKKFSKKSNGKNMNNLKLYENDEIENEIRHLKGEDFTKLLKTNNTYEYHYFLSPIRHNLFNWYPFNEQGSLLEIGSSYGQLTSLFIEKVGKVVAVEDGESKAEIISNRAPKAKVIVSDFDDMDVDDKFDYIILCNVFEYARSFMDSENPYEDYLRYLKTFLKEDGVILIAISNRLGLKYFSGFKEEHSNQFFTGIDGYDEPSDFETFTKHELIDIIQSSGFSNYKFFYPYPDHAFPNEISTDEFINKKPYHESSEYFNERSNLFREDKLNQTLARDNLSQFFSNSFLVEIRNSDNDFPSDKIDYVSLDLDRKEKFKSTTLISNGKASQIQLSGNFDDVDENIDFGFGKIKYHPCEISSSTIEYQLPEESLESILSESIYKNDKATFFKTIENYYEALIYNSEKSKDWTSNEFKAIFKIMPKTEFHYHEKSSLDLTFDKIHIIDGNYLTTGYEWLFEFPVPLEYVLFRAISQEINNNPLFKEFITIGEAFNYLNINLINLDLFDEWESRFSKYVSDSSVFLENEIIPKENLDCAEQMGKYLNSTYILEQGDCNKTQQLKRDIVINQRNIIKQKNEEIEKKNKQIKRKNRIINNKNKKIKEYSNSISWKVTKPFRKFKSLF